MGRQQMRTGRTTGTLLARLERLECRAAVSRKLKTRFGNLRRLPPDYVGERHMVIAKHLPCRFGQEWVEFEEAPGPDPSSELDKYLNIVFVASNSKVAGAEVFEEVR